MMSRPLPELRALVRRLVEWASPDPTVRGRVDAGERILQALSERLGLLVGTGGFHMLLERALKRAREEHRLLGNVRPDPHGGRMLGGLAEAVQDEDPEEVASAVEAVITELIGLVSRFLGADMAVRLVRQSLPDAPLGNVESGLVETNDE
jgi:hypothetical protein